MSDKYIENKECNMCDSSDGLGVYQREDSSFHGKCFSCGGHTNSPYDGEVMIKEKDPFENEESKNDNLLINISKLGYNNLESRGIDKSICKKYEVRSKLDSNGKDILHYYPLYKDGVIKGYQERKVDSKKFKNIGHVKSPQFFGQNKSGSSGKLIIVTEGSADMMAAKQMLLSEDKNYRVISITNGAAAAAKCFKDNYEWISSFESIMLAFDMDDPGRKACEEVGGLFEPNKVKQLEFSEKDPNDMLRKGKSKEFLRAIFDAKESHPDGVVSVDDLFEEALKPIEKGLSYPWPTLNNDTYGYRRSELIGIGAGSGSGKTNAFKEMIDWTIFHHHLPAGVIFLEEPAAKTLKTLAGKHMNKTFHVPDSGWTVDELRKGLNELKGKVFFFDHFGSKGWDSIKEKIRYMVNALGIKDIFLDHLTALVAQEEDEYRALNKIMEELSSLTQELDCTIFFISHLRNPNGKSHEEGGQVSADQFKGSGAIRFWSHFIFGLERNQQAEDVIERNTTKFRVLKDRNTGLSTGLTFELFYDHKLGRWKEVNNEEFSDEEI